MNVFVLMGRVRVGVSHGTLSARRCEIGRPNGPEAQRMMTRCQPKLLFVRPAGKLLFVRLAGQSPF